MNWRRRRWLALSGAVIALTVGIAASVGAAAGGSDSGLSCPAGTKLMGQIADYDETGPIDGFDTPEQALANLVSKAYPGMPRGQFKKVSSDSSKAEFESDLATSSVIEVDRLVPQPGQVQLTVQESGTEWVVSEFAICESNARRWAAR